MFKTRLISGIVLVAIALVVIITGGNVLLSVMGIISLIGMFELYRVFQMEKSLAAVVGYLAAIAFYLNLYFGFFTDPMILPMLFLILLLAVYVFSYPKYKADQIMACFFALFCGNDAFLYLPDQNVGRWRVSGMADLSLFLGK